MLLAVGLVFLLDNLDLVESGTILRFWPLILLVAGLKNLIAAQDRGSAVSGTLPAAVGALLLLNALNLIDVDLRDFWPVILVPIGIRTLMESDVETAGAGEESRGGGR